MNTITIELCQEDRKRLDSILAALQSNDTPSPAQEAPMPANEITLADIQRKVVDLSNAGKKEPVRDIIKKHADRVSGIPEDKLPEVWAQLNALEV